MEPNDKKQVKTIKKVYPQIYSYELTDMHDHDGWQKIGYTERKDVDERIREQTQTAAFKLNYRKLWSASSVFVSNHSGFFTDKDLHKYYIKNNIARSRKQDDGGFGEEWFYFDGTPEVSKQLFDEYASQDFSRQTMGKTAYTLRDEQEKAVLDTLEYAAKNQTTDFANPNEKARCLWNAKPRFGKTLTSYDFAKRFNAKNVLIVTNRPAIANSWYDDFEKFIDGYYFISTTDSLKDRPSITREQFLNRANKTESDKQITFLSLQDLKGGKIFGGGYDKLKWVADLEWDLLIVDEAHEGVDTERTDEAFKKIKRRFTLHLSGTPFKAIADGYFSADQILCNWTYIEEQKAKQKELEAGNDAGDHVNMPDMRLFTYKMSDMIESRLDEGIEIDDENLDYAFELNDMFSTDQNGRFVHEREILTFLDQLTMNKKYPFSTQEMRDELKHTFWLVGNRVASAKAMEKLLRNHPVFGHGNYEIVLAAGDGKPNSDDDTSEEEMQNIAANEKAYDRVKRAIRNNDRTITLSVGQLTTGVTIEEWSAVLMLSDIKSESLYMQAIFRSQNPYKYTDEIGDTYRKKSAYVFDFSPNRVLKVYDKFANSLLAKAAQGEITEKEREANVAELLNYFPVLAEDKDGEMIELNAEQVLTFPKAIIAKEVVNRGFVTNLLFVNINNVFNIPSEVINALNKASSTNDTGRQTKNEDVDHNPSRQIEKNHRISVNKEKLLGDKVYGSRMQEIVAIAVDQESDDKVVDRIVDGYINEAQEPFSVYKEIYSPSKAEFEELQNNHFEKVREIAEEYVSKGLSTAKNQAELADKLSELIENDLPNDTVVRKEEENYEEEELNEMDQIRKKLRTFTRAIPSFVMASQNPDIITLDNIEDTVSDEDFEVLFTENDSTPFTKDDFRMIRGPWTNPETGEKFEGFFDRYTFNAAIKEFEEKRKEVADYLRPGINEDIFSYIRPLKTNQIFTPRRIVNQMLDCLEEDSPTIFSNPDITFCDLYVKSGLYLTEIAKRLNRGLEAKIPDRNERIRHIFENQLYGFAPTNIIFNIAKKYIYGITFSDSKGNLKQCDLTESFKKGDTLGMKFDVVIGNPPYNLSVNQDTSQTKPIYHVFVDMAKKINPKYLSMIIPARWYAGGIGLDEFRNSMLADKHIKRLVDYPNGRDCFPANNVSGGVCYFLRDRDNEGLCSYTNIINGVKSTKERDLSEYDTFIRYNEALEIVKKVSSLGEESLSTIASSLNPFGFNSASRGAQNRDDIHNIKLVSSKGDGYVSRDEISAGLELVDKYKVLIGKAISGHIGETDADGKVKVVARLDPLNPNEVCTFSYFVVGAFDNAKERDNLLAYMKTKFARFLLLQALSSMNISKDKFNFVPLQDFTTRWDDDKLYSKYHLTNDEINFIENSIKEMA